MCVFGFRSLLAIIKIFCDLLDSVLLIRQFVCFILFLYCQNSPTLTKPLTSRLAPPHIQACQSRQNHKLQVFHSHPLTKFLQNYFLTRFIHLWIVFACYSSLAFDHSLISSFSLFPTSPNHVLVTQSNFKSLQIIKKITRISCLSYPCCLSLRMRSRSYMCKCVFLFCNRVHSTFLFFHEVILVSQYYQNRKENANIDLEELSTIWLVCDVFLLLPFLLFAGGSSCLDEW